MNIEFYYTKDLSIEKNLSYFLFIKKNNFNYQKIIKGRESLVNCSYEEING